MCERFSAATKRTYRAIVAVALTLVFFSTCEVRASDALNARRQDVDRQFQEKLASLADKCEKLELPAQAALTRNWFVRRAADREYYFFPSDADRAKLPANTPMIAQQWHDRFLKLRAEQADALFEIAKHAATESRTNRAAAAWAYQLLFEVLRENPDHAEARRTLGYIKVLNEWRTTTKDARPSSPRFDHPQYAWRKGQYWRLESEHFRINTNHSAKAAVDIGQRLEELHTVWRQLFFRYWCSGETLAARLQGGKEPLAKTHTHEVVLYRNREEYINALSREQPQIHVTLGLYADKQQTSYLYAGDDAARSTWLHEVTHQLFQETLELPTGAGSKANVWALEAIAVYMESLQRVNGYCVLGGIDADRLQFARYRTLRNDFNAPLEKMVSFGRDALQRDNEIRRLYGHAAGLAHFFMDSQRGKYRENFVDYLVAIYHRRDTPETLASFCGVGLGELDQQYLAYLKNVGDDDLQSLRLAEGAHNLCLGNTHVTDAGVGKITGVERLELLDLGTTKTSDAGLRAFQTATGVKQLFLEQTQLGDASLEWIGKLSQLEELDLSNTQITDAGVMKLGGLRNLKRLFLFNCNVTDAGLQELQGLKQLEEIELRGTKTTAKGLQQLKDALPKLRAPTR